MALYNNVALSDSAVIKIPSSFKDEKHLQKVVVKYIRAAYGSPLIGVSFMGNKIFGNDGTSRKAYLQIQEAKAMGLMKGWPDLVVLSPSRGYHGLAMELKANPGTVFLKNGGFVADKHAREQAQVLEDLNAEGYLSVFAEGWDHAFNIIEWYFEKGPEPKAIQTITFDVPCRYTGAPGDSCRVVKLVF